MNAARCVLSRLKEVFNFCEFQYCFIQIICAIELNPNNNKFLLYT